MRAFQRHNPSFLWNFPWHCVSSKKNSTVLRPSPTKPGFTWKTRPFSSETNYKLPLKSCHGTLPLFSTRPKGMPWIKTHYRGILVIKLDLIKLLHWAPCPTFICLLTSQNCRSVAFLLRTKVWGKEERRWNGAICLGGSEVKDSETQKKWRRKTVAFWDPPSMKASEALPKWENAENVLVVVLFFENQKWVVVTRE